jgi:hypothetical protein
MWTGSWLIGELEGREYESYSENFEQVAKYSSPFNAFEWPHSQSEDRIFDLASLTKIIATRSLLDETFNGEKGAFFSEANFDQTFGAFLTTEQIVEFQLSSLQGVTLRELLEHRSGLKAHKFLGSVEKNFRKVQQGLERDSQILKCLGASVSPHKRGLTEYSDLGFWALGFILEKQNRLSLRDQWSQYLEKNFKNPMGGFLDYGPIAINTKEIKKTLHTEMRHPRGEVNDDNAMVLGGAAPHAGLFGNLKGVEAWILLILKNFLERSRLKDLEVIKNHSERFFLGWDSPSEPLEESQAGYPASAYVLGHLGFTGTALWIDFSTKRYGILLTNRVFVSSDNQKSLDLIRSLRKSFFSLVWQNRPIQEKIKTWKGILKTQWLHHVESQMMI